MVYPAKWVEFFGPPLWKALHAIAFSIPENPDAATQQKYRDFFNALAPVIPCEACGKHYADYLLRNPVDATQLPVWLYNLHDDVNRRNNKTSPSFEQVKDMYTGWNQQKQDKLAGLSAAERARVLADPHNGALPEPSVCHQTLLLILVGALLLLLLGLIAFRKCKEEKKTREE